MTTTQAKPHIQRVLAVTPDVLGELSHLLSQLSPGTTPPTPAEGAALTAAGTHLFVARNEHHRVMAMATLVGAHTPTGRKWWIEDVVVDNAARGQGLGRAIVAHLIDYARNHGGGQLQLTSRPARVAANALYSSMGFERKPTNVYVMHL